MDGKLRTARSASQWQRLAADLLHKIRVRWRLTSDRSFSQRLHINARTAAKLNRLHPDAMLRFDTVMGIFRTLLLIIPSQEWSPSRCKEEDRMIKTDMLAVVNAKIPVPKGVLDDLNDAIDNEQNLSGE